MSLPQMLTGLADIAENYDALIVDFFVSCTMAKRRLRAWMRPC